MKVDEINQTYLGDTKMAYIPLSNGGAVPVFATDVLDGPLNQVIGPNGLPGTQYPQTYPGPAGVVGADYPVPTTNFAGPKYDFFKIDFAAEDITESAGVGEALQLLLQTIQNGGSTGGATPAYVCGGTVAMYSATQVTAGSASFVSVALYPTGAYNLAVDGSDDSSTTMTAVISGLGTQTFQDGTTFDFSGVAVTQPGFQLV